MAYTNFIAAIDLGTSHIVGMVGVKNDSGVLSIIAYEVEQSANCIRRGCVYNVEETANKIKRLILKLENKLQGAKIGKVYVGVGGQSLRTIEHTVPRILGVDGDVTEEVIDSLYKECCNYHPDMLEVLSIASPAYYLDDKQEANPVGIPCQRIEARYKLIVGRPSLKRNIITSIAERAKIEIAGLLVAPLALSDAVLSDDEKTLGCALIGFGAGVTTLSVYKGGQLINLRVIPFGGNLITKDITSLNMVEAEAERVKKTYGSAIAEKEVDTSIQVSAANGMGLRDIKLYDLNTVIEARMQEILENVYARLDAIGVLNTLGAGIVIVGGGAALKNLTEAIKDRLKMDVRYSSVRKGLVSERSDLVVFSPEYTTAIGLLLKGSDNCAVYVAPKADIAPAVEKEKELEPQKYTEPPKEEGKKGKGSSIKDAIGHRINIFTKNIDTMTKDLFDNEEKK